MTQPYLIYTDTNKEEIESSSNPLYVLRGMIVYSSTTPKYALPESVLTDPNYAEKEELLSTLPIEYLSNEDFTPPKND